MIYSDGFSNKKESGYTVCNADGDVLVREVFPNRRTCNEAELRGVRAALNYSQDSVITDSKVVTYWVQSGKCQARPDLTPVVREVQTILRERGIRLKWLPREENLAGSYNESTRTSK